MPPTSANIKALTKTDHRKTWQTLKATHKAAIKAAKLNFDQKFGPALDKYSVAVMTATKAFVGEKVDPKAVQKVVAAARPLDVIARAYLVKTKTLPNPAGKELTTFLTKIHTDCEGWEQVSNMFAETEGHAAGTPQHQAVKELYPALDKLMAQTGNLVTNLPLVKNELTVAISQDKKPTVKPPKTSADDWKVLVALPQDAWAALFRPKALAFIASADALAGAVATVRTDVAPLLTAAVKFDETSDYGSYKQRARAVMAGSLPIFHNLARDYAALQADPELISRLGYKQGLPHVNTSRTVAAAGTAQKAARELIELIYDLP